MPPSSDASSPLNLRDQSWVIGLSIALAVYSLFVGIALLSGALSAGHAAWLLALVPFVLSLWYGYGFLQPNSLAGNTSAPDYGLLFSAGGWALTVLALLVAQPAQPAPLAGSNASSSGDVAAAFCGALAILCILCGGALSWRARIQDDGDDESAYH